MEKTGDQIIGETHRQALYLWAGLCLALTLFFVQSQIVFVKGEPAPTAQTEWVFSGVGIVTFVMGLLFFRNYTGLRRLQWLKMPFAQRKQNLLVAYVIQFILFETLGLYGVLLSVLSKNTWKAVPFMVFAYLGFILSFPKKSQLDLFFRKGS